MKAEKASKKKKGWNNFIQTHNLHSLKTPISNAKANNEQNRRIY